MLQDFSFASGKKVLITAGFIVSSAVLSACSTVNQRSGFGGDIIQGNFGHKGRPCVTEFNTASKIMYISQSCSAKQIKEAATAYKQEGYPVGGVSILGDKKFSLRKGGKFVWVPEQPVYDPNAKRGVIGPKPKAQ